MHVIAIIVGAFMVVSIVLDLINTLVTTSTSRGRYWLTNVLYSSTWAALRVVAMRLSDRQRRIVLTTFAPVSVLLLLTAWVIQQVIGFGLIWWGWGGIDGAASLVDYIYYSGVVYFTLGFGELVPVEVIPRFGALTEAFSGVLTTALVIGYLPALYNAYSDRETKLMTLDDGSEGRITPTALIMSRMPDGDKQGLLQWYASWEDWIAGIIDTHMTFPMLALFRSKHVGQSWITAVGVIADSATLCEMIVGMENRQPYWCVRRATVLFNELTEGVDLTEYQKRQAKAAEEKLAASYDSDHPFSRAYREMEARGIELMPYDQANTITSELRTMYLPQMEYLIDFLLAPRGFWGHVIGHRNPNEPNPVIGAYRDEDVRGEY